jgi:GNAT superfamily N-acetyltransferase
MKTMIRRANVRDFDGIFPLLEQLWEKKKLDKTGILRVWKRELGNRDYAAFIAVTGGRIAGFAGAVVNDSLWVAGTLCNLNQLVVNRNDRGAGIGSQLLNAVEKFAVKKKCNGITLESGNFRKQAHAFYKAKGFDGRAVFFNKLF